MSEPSTKSERAKTKLTLFHSIQFCAGSLWQDDDKNSEDELEDDQIKQLESLFAQKQKSPPFKDSSKKLAQAKDDSAAKKEVNLVDGKRAYNVQISLAQYRKFDGDYDELCNHVMTLNSSKLDFEKVQNLKEILPAYEDLKAINGYKGDVGVLGKCEKFFLAVSKRKGE